MLHYFKTVVRFSDSWLHITTAFVSFTFQDTTFNKQVSTLFDNLFQRFTINSNRIFIDQGAYMVVLIKRIPDPKLFIGINKRIPDLVVNGFMDNEPACRCTSLTCCSHSTKYCTDSSHFYICIRGDNYCVVTT